MWFCIIKSGTDSVTDDDMNMNILLTVYLIPVIDQCT